MGRRPAKEPDQLLDRPPGVIVFVSAIEGLGGPARSLLTVMQTLEGRCIRVLASGTGSLSRVAMERGAVEDTVDLGLRQVGTERTTLRYVRAGLRLALWCVKERRHLIAIHANGAAELHLSAMASLVTRRPVVVWAHAWQPSRWSPRLGPLWRAILPDVRWAAVSPIARDVLLRERMAAPGEVTLVANPIDPDDMLATRNPSDGTLAVAYLGTRARSKGFHLLPEIIRECGDLDVRWLLAMGEPDSRWSRDELRIWSELRALGDRIDVVGKVDDARLVYGRSEIVVCPSLDESFGRIAAEAMLNGIPVVASDIPALKDLVGDSGAGVVFPAGDAKAASRAIRALAGDRELRLRLGAAGQARASAFAPGSITAELGRLYRLP